MKVILTFIVNPRAAWATFKKQKGEGDSVKPYKKNTVCTTIKLLQPLETAGKSTSKLQNPVERTEQHDCQVVVRTMKTGEQDTELPSDRP